MKTGLLISAFIVWRMVGSGIAGDPKWIQCEKFEQQSCGMNFYNCTTKMDYRCMNNVEVLETSPEKVEGRTYRANSNAEFIDPPFWFH